MGPPYPVGAGYVGWLWVWMFGTGIGTSNHRVDIVQSNVFIHQHQNSVTEY
jgi:hypothetical protein